MRRLFIILGFLLIAPLARAQYGSFQNNCEVGGTKVVSQGISSTNFFQGSFPGCLVTVNLAGTSTRATIYADDGVTPLSNPFTASTTTGNFIFYSTTFQPLDVVIAYNPAQPVLTKGMPSFTYSNVEVAGGGGQPLFCAQGKNTFGIDDSAELNAVIAGAYAYSAAIPSPYASGPSVSTCGGKSYFSNTLNMPMNLIYDQFNVQENPAIGTQTGLRVYNAGIGSPAGRIQNSSIIGCGAGCSGSLIELVQTPVFGFVNDNITEGGGKCINAVNSERVSVDAETTIGPCEQDVNVFAASNEWKFFGTAIDSGIVNAISGNPQYVYSNNATNGVWPAANTGPGGTPTVLYPAIMRAAIVVDNASDFHIESGSVKGSQDSPMVWSQRANVTIGSGYIEQCHTSTCLISGGPILYTPTTAALTSTNVAVSATTYVFGATATISGCAATNPIASQPTNQVQHFWIDSPTDAAALGYLGNFVFYPPDFFAGSTSASCLGGGVLQGQWLQYEGAGYTNTASPQLQLASLTPIGGCSNPGPNPLTACTQHNAIAWPSGAITGEQVAGGVLALHDSHINGFDGPTTGYVLAADNTTALTAAEISVGSIPDPYQVPQNLNVNQSSLILSNNEMFSSLVAPGVGLIAAHTTSYIDLSQENIGTIPTQSNDTLFSSYLDPYYLFGPYAVQADPFGEVSINLGGAGSRTISGSQSTIESHVATLNPATQTYNPGRVCVPGCMDGTKPPAATLVATAGTSGSIVAPTSGQALAVSVAWVNSTPYGPGGYEAIYNNATLTNAGTAYLTGPKVTVDGTQDFTITNIQTVASGNHVMVTTSGSNSYTVGQVATFTGMQATNSLPLNGDTCTVTATGNPYTCTPNNGVTVGNAGPYSEVGETMISDCSGWVTVGSVSSGSIAHIGNTSAARPGMACTVAPGTSMTLIFSRAPGDTTGSGAAGTLIAQGTTGSASQTQLFNFTPGTTNNSITVTSPGADPNGPAQYYSIYVGPYGYQYIQGTYPISTSSVTVTSATFTPNLLSGAQVMMPLNCGYNCTPNALAGFEAYNSYQMQHWSTTQNAYVPDMAWVPGTGFAYNEPVTINGNLTVTGTCTGCGSSGITLTTTGSSGPATLISGVLNVPVYSSGGITGSGTANYYPLWTGTTALGNGHIDDGVTTSGFLTLSEPANVPYSITNNDTSSGSVYPGAMNVNFTATTPAQTLAITGVTLVSGQTYLFMATNTLVAGRVVYFPVSQTNFNNFTGGATALNGQTVTVLSSGLSSTQFEAVITGTVTSSSSISPPATGYTPAQAVLPGMRVVSTGPGYTNLCPSEYYQGTLFGASYCIEAAPLGVGGPDASAIFGSSYTIDPYVGSNASQFFAYCLNSYTRCWGTNPSAQIISVHTAATGTSGANTITLSSLPGYGTILPTMGIWNSTGITDGTQVQSISGLTVTLTANNIGTVSGQVNFAPMHANMNAAELDLHAEAPASFSNAYVGALIGLSIASNLPTGGTWNATGIRMPAIFCKTADGTPCYYKQGFSTDRADFSPATGTILNFGAAGTATCTIAGATQNPCISTGTVTNFGSATLEADYLNYYDIVTQAPVDVRFQRLIAVPSSTYAANPTSFTMRYSFVGNADVTGAIPIYEYQANGVGASEFKIDDGTGGSATITAAPTSLLELNGNANVSTAGIVTGTGFATGSAGVTGAVVFGSVGGGTVSLQPSTAIATTNTLLFPNSALASDTIATLGVSNTFAATQNFLGITLGATNAITWNGLTKARVPGDGKIEFTDNAGDGAFIRAMFGGTTAASPAFCFSGTSIQVCGADGTAVGSFTSPSLSTADLAFGSKTTYSPSACETGFGATSVNTSGFTTGTGLNCLPANSVIDAVVYRITADITTAASFTVGQTGSTTQFCSTQSTLTSGTTGICIPPAYAVQSTSAGVAVTFNATPGAGALRLIVYYHTFTPPTS